MEVVACFPEPLEPFPALTSTKADIVVEINSFLQWNLVFDYDNSGNDGQITQTVSIEKTGTYTTKTFRENIRTTTRKLVQDRQVSAEVGVSYGPVSVTMKFGYQNTKELTDMLQNTISIQTEETKTWKITETREYVIGPRGRLCLYQRSFIHPGMSVVESTFRTTPKPLPSSELVESAPIVYKLRPTYYISGFEVVYTDQYLDRPSNFVRDANGGSGDINAGFGGRYVWLVPIKDTRTTVAKTGFEIVIQGNADNRYYDLAKGAKGDYRYLVPLKESDEPEKLITTAVLYRSGDAPNLGSIYSGHTIDINKGRKGDFLYLCWNTQIAYPI